MPRAVSEEPRWVGARQFEKKPARPTIEMRNFDERSFADQVEDEGHHADIVIMTGAARSRCDGGPVMQRRPLLK